ncbi:MAG: hypothetical protein A2Y95_09435 [Deltaproteobacteria bacterium RBG_13_65_10]|nr:MAG: hypothetical protein A2Y95_09435 [Deltaproteobacteria bacterium RBG_13_65_10]
MRHVRCSDSDGDPKANFRNPAIRGGLTWLEKARRSSDTSDVPDVLGRRGTQKITRTTPF